VEDPDRKTRDDPDPAPTRSSLIQRLGDWQDQVSWQEFFDTYWRLIYSVAMRAGLSDVEARDVVQETVLSVAKQMQGGRFDKARGSFKAWLCCITRRRIVDLLRRRTDPAFRCNPSEDGDSTGTGLLERQPDPASLDLDTVWEVEWQRNLVEAALERVRREVSPKQFQIYDLAVLRDMPVREVTRLLKVNAAQVYLARHRVGALLKKEVRRLEARASESSTELP
jgi:RNA polymerase sigma factor (sigma-70 family)